MRAAFFGLPIAVALAASSARAEEIVPTVYPFLPELVVNEEPDVCGPFHAVVTEAFLAPDFDISIIGREWPEADMRQVEFTALGVSEAAERPYYAQGEVLGTRVDLERDGKDEVLAHVYWNHSWRGNQHFLVLYPDFAAFEKARIATQTAALNSTDEAGADQVLGAAKDIKYGIGSGSVQKPATKGEYWDWTWVEPQAIEVNGRYYVLSEGEVYNDDVSTSLWRISSSGATVLACQVRLFPDDKGFGVGPLRDTRVGLLEDVLRSLAGQESFFSGTSRALANTLGAGGRVASRLAVRPWVLAAIGPRAERAGVEWALRRYSYESLWNFRTYRRFKALEPQAIDALAVYYEESFGLSPGDARHWAQISIANLVSGFFLFGADTYETNLSLDEIDKLDRQQPRTLRRALLLGEDVEEVAALLAERDPTGPDAYQSVSSKRTDDPLLVFALEHPTLVQLLLADGATSNATNDFGKTPLMYAAHFNLLESAHVLLTSGALVNAQTLSEPNGVWNAIKFNQRTALMYAMENAGPEMVALLLKNGANPNAVDTGRRNMMDYLSLNMSLTKADRASIEGMLRESGYQSTAP